MARAITNMARKQTLLKIGLSNLIGLLFSVLWSCNAFLKSILSAGTESHQSFQNALCQYIFF